MEGKGLKLFLNYGYTLFPLSYIHDLNHGDGDGDWRGRRKNFGASLHVKLDG